MSNVCVYTCITGKYDHIREVKSKQQNNVDFVCFTDQSFQSNTWHTKPIPKDLDGLSQVKKQRVVKILPHKWLDPKYEISIWVDGNIEIIDDLCGFISQYDLEKTSFYTRLHPIRHCLFDEATACISMNKDSPQIIEKQVEFYKNDGYPKNIGMAETGIILRKHNDKKCILLDNLWASELLKWSHRDQLSFNYACWKLHFLPGYLSNEFSINKSKYFRITPHG